MVLLGDQRPRLEHIPIYENTQAGEDAIEQAQIAGLYLDNWEQYVLSNSLGRDKDGLWTAFEVLLIVSRQNGKGSIYEAREIFGLFDYPSDRLLIHTAHEHKTASEHFLRIWTLVENTPSLSKNVARHSTAYGREFIETKPKPTIILGPGGHQIRRVGRKRLLFIARSGSSGRGFTGDFIAYDEAMFLEAGKVSASLPSLSARPNPQVFYAGSAGFKTSTQLAKVRRRGVAGKSKRLMFMEWSAQVCDEYCDSGCTVHDDPFAESTFARNNPGYGVRISHRFWENELEAFDGNLPEWNREHLGVGEYPLPENAWFVIPKSWFDRSVLKADPIPRVRNPIFSVDIARGRNSAAITVAGLLPDGRVGIQLIDFHEGTGWIVKRVKAIHEQWKPKFWIIDKRAAAGSVISDLEKAGIPVKVLQASEVAHASGLLYDAFRDETLWHFNQDAIRKSLAGADWRNLSESQAFDRVNSAVDIAPLMSMAFAHWGYLEFVEEDYDSRDTVYFGLDRIRQMWKTGHYGPDDIKRLFDRGLIGKEDLEDLANEGIFF